MALHPLCRCGPPPATAHGASESGKSGLSHDGSEFKNTHTSAIVKELWTYIWPSRDAPDAKYIKTRVVAALGLMVGSKLVNIQVPFFFKDAVDYLATIPPDATVAAATAALPISLILGCPLPRCDPAPG